jgi:fructokinase
MPRVFTIGEALLDIIFKDNQPVSAIAGGSMLNTSVALGRLGVPVQFISDFGKDEIGNILEKFLHDNQVGTDFIERYDSYKTGLALAFLNAENDATYSFYKNNPATRLNNISINFERNDILLFGSYYALDDSVRDSVLKMVKSAHEAGAIIIYDPNFRKPHLHELDRLIGKIIENISYSDIVRASDEDLDFIFDAGSANEAYQKIAECGCDNLIYTSQKNDVLVHSKQLSVRIPVHSIQTLSTIGAGDNFNAGLIWTLFSEGVLKKDIPKLSQKKWGKIAGMGIDFATDVCLQYDNYISLEFARKVLKGKV